MDGPEFIRKQKRGGKAFINSLGFTLIELLVVMVIILTVTAMLLPAVQTVRNHAKTSLCASNINKLLYSMLAYESLNDSLPYGFYMRIDAPPGGFPGFTMYDRTGWWWFNFIDAYSGNAIDKPSLIKCPANCITDKTLKKDILAGNYGVNASICKGSYRTDPEFRGKPFNRNNISEPGNTILLVDSGYAVITWKDSKNPPDTSSPGGMLEKSVYVPGQSVNSKRKLYSPGQQPDAISGRHPGKMVNVGFADGHVSLEKADELLTDSNGNIKGSGLKWKAK